MPTAVAYVAQWVSTEIWTVAAEVGASDAAATVAAAAAYAATATAAYYGIAQGVMALSPKPNMNSLRSNSTQVMVQGTSESHRIIYGQIQVSGVFYPLGCTGANNEYLHFLVVYAAHECDSFGELKVMGESVALDGAGNVVSGKYSGLMTVKPHLGAWNQTVDTDIQAAFGTSFWPDTARLRGRAYDYIRIKYDQNVAGAGVPGITRMISGRKVWDPRDDTQDPNNPDTFKWSANSALCSADWVMGVPMKNGAGNIMRNYGFRATPDEVDMSALIEAANICDEPITLA